MLELKEFATRDEWLAAREKSIGSSEAAAIIGFNPYMSNEELFDIKTGRKQPKDISDKSYVRYGTEAEQYLRELFRMDFPSLKVFYIPNNMFVNSEHPRFHASLDGWTEDEKGRKGILEIKTVNINSALQKQKWGDQNGDRIPDNYYVQILHDLIITEFDYADLWAWLKYDFDGKVFRVVRHYHIESKEIQEDLKYLREEERKFADCIRNDKRPPLILPRL